MRCIGIDIGKKTCEVCVIDREGNVLERTSYVNTLANAAKCVVPKVLHPVPKGIRWVYKIKITLTKV